MRVYEIETRHFSFRVCCMDSDQFQKLFRKAWKQHCKDYEIDYDPEFVRELIEDYGGNYIIVEPGVVYREWEPIIYGDDGRE